VTLSVEVAPDVVGINEPEVKFALAPDGSPVNERLTEELYPFNAVNVTVYVVLPVPEIVWRDGLALIEKSGTTTFTVTIVECVSEPAVPVTVIG